MGRRLQTGPRAELGPSQVSLRVAVAASASSSGSGSGSGPGSGPATCPRCVNSSWLRSASVILLIELSVRCLSRANLAMINGPQLCRHCLCRRHQFWPSSPLSLSLCCSISWAQFKGSMATKNANWINTQHTKRARKQRVQIQPIYIYIHMYILVICVFVLLLCTQIATIESHRFPKQIQKVAHTQFWVRLKTRAFLSIPYFPKFFTTAAKKRIV